jgi:hypothetical protein
LLIELSAEGKSFVTLEELAIPFSKHIVERLRSALMVKKLIFASDEGEFTRPKGYAASRS